jgi:hypothetical protein
MENRTEEDTAQEPTEDRASQHWKELNEAHELLSFSPWQALEQEQGVQHCGVQHR